MFKRNSSNVLQTVLLLMLFLGSSSIGLAQDARLIARNIFPSVVMLEMRDGQNRPISLGSGFFVRPDVVVTNYHVIQNASSGSAKVVGKSAVYPIEGIVGIDKARDLALLKLTGVRAKPVVLADISKIEVGQEVFALGNPKGLEGTISAGIISGSSLREVNNENLIQITAPISPGSSGGPVVNREGEVIGVAVASLKGGQNLNFAIPSSYLAILLANSKSVVSLSDAKQSPSENKTKDTRPSSSDTVQWLVSKLEGAQSLEERQGINVFRTTASLRISGCKMEIEKMVKVFKPGARALASVENQTFFLNWITYVGPALLPAGATESFIAIYLDRKVNYTIAWADGTSENLKIDFVKLPVADKPMAERVTSAFERLIELCKEDSKREPF